MERNIIRNKNTQPKSSKKKIISIIIALLVIVSFIVVSISTYVGWNLITPKRETVDKTPKEYGLVYDDISFNSTKDDVLLKGWWIPAQNMGSINESDKTVIFVHGYGDNRLMKDIEALNLSKKLAKSGYNVLTFDFRASGESEGKFSSIGEMEKYDVLSAIKFAKEQKQSKDIHLLGWSMGAVASILAGTESPDVKTIIADSPFANLRSYLEENLPKWSNLPSVPFTPIIMKVIPALTGFNVDNVDPVSAVSNLEDKHLLLIHSKDDETIPYQNSEIIYDAVKDKELSNIWITEGAKHVRSYTTNPDEYEKRVLEFLEHGSNVN